MNLEEYLRTVLEGFVSEPEKLHVNQTQDQMGVLLSVDVSKDDMGKVIGRSGETAKALRTLMRVVGSAHQAKVSIRINEPAGNDRRNYQHRDLDEALKSATEA